MAYPVRCIGGSNVDCPTRPPSRRPPPRPRRSRKRPPARSSDVAGDHQTARSSQGVRPCSASHAAPPGPGLAGPRPLGQWSTLGGKRKNTRKREDLPSMWAKGGRRPSCPKRATWFLVEYFIPPNMTFRRIPRRGAGSSVCFRPAPIARPHRRVLSFSTSPIRTNQTGALDRRAPFTEGWRSL